MVKQTIQIFCRIKPTKSSKAGLYEINDEQTGALLNFTLPRELSEGLVNNKRESFKYRFEHVFDQTAKQDEVFDQVAKPVIDNVLHGYNGTIFAYGQTGSGKTFTITGGPEKYSDRGIIPRTVSYIFDYQAKNSDYEFTTHISYLEIYNENGYDLLDPKHEASKLEDLPKVSLMEDSKQNVHLRNLSTHKANTEEDALNLLFLGDTNRMIAETPMNQASTRSHCIFTIHVSCREVGSATIRKAKLHLVDLAGSERVAKTGVGGVLLTEAKYINLSLHFLEQVIVALGEKTRSHIPYRNSMMTSVLRDSLGGNCMTTMIATCSIERKNLAESISTCNFAQRVALIKNDAILNEELDPKLIIARLKREVEQLKEELAMATGEQRSDELSVEDLERCEEAVKHYLDDTDPSATISIGADMRKIHRCFFLLKKQIMSKTRLASPTPEQTPTPRNEEPLNLPTAPAQSTEVTRLQQLISQRDNEINILVNMLKKEKKRAADAVKQLHANGHSVPSDNAHTESRASDSSMSRSASVESSVIARKSARREKEEKTKTKILGEMSMGRQEAFETFRRDYQKNRHIEESKKTLKQKYAEAKSLGEKVNSTRVKINKLKASLEQHRMSRVMQGLVDPENPEPDEMEVEMRSQMEAAKQNYKDAFSTLRSLKTEIEHSQHLLEKAKVQLMKDFEIWWADQTTRAEEQKALTSTSKQSIESTRDAWRTPSAVSAASFSTENSKASLFSENSGVASQSSNIYPNHNHLSNGKAEPRTLNEIQHRGMGQKKRWDEPSQGVIPLTGDPKADADIMAFMRARQHIAQQAQNKR